MQTKNIIGSCLIIGVFCAMFSMFVLTDTIGSRDSVPCHGNQRCYSTIEQAQNNVPTYIRNCGYWRCFVWRDGPRTHPWRVIPGHGCAHWVAHELNIRANPGCASGHAIRVRDIIRGRMEIRNLRNCRPNDIWTTTNRGHAGIVREVNRRSGRVLVEHCTARANGLARDWMSTGICWRR